MAHETLPAPMLKRIGKHQWRVETDYIYVDAYGGRTVIKKGFITDGASSPFRILIESFGGHYSTEVVAHDWFYTKINEGNPAPAAPTRKHADRLFFEGLKRSGVNRFVRLGMWIAVRVFGGPGFRKIGVR